MRKSLFIFSILSLGFIASADANWQYPKNYSRDVWNGDDGMRFVISVRGGAAYGTANIKNEIGGLTGQYMIDINTGEIIPKAYYDAAFPSGSTDYAYAGYAKLGDLPVADNYKDISVAVGVSAGFTMPDAPQWRVEFGFDHISESDYNQNPLFDGELTLIPTGLQVEVQSGGAQSSMSSDIYSIMAFYDFFDGVKKPVKEIIPYLGVGAGYADTKTMLQLTDAYGDLSDVYELQNFGIADDAGVIQFHKAETHTSNLVPMLAVGVSYGINERMYLDAGLRGMYVSKVKWQLTNAAATQSEEKRRDWFSAEKLMYVNAMVGFRVEF